MIIDPSTFEDYFSYFFHFGIKDAKLPNEFEAQAELYYFNCFEKFRDKLGELSQSASSIAPDFIKLTFAFQYFCEKRLRVAPMFKGMNHVDPILLSSHESMKKQNKEYDHYYFSLSEEDLKQSKKWFTKSMRYASFFRELKGKGKTDAPNISRMIIDISPAFENGVVGATETIEIPDQFFGYLIREMENLFFSYRAQMYLSGSISNHKRSMPIIISMLREPLVKYLRNKFSQLQNSSEDTRKIESLLVALVLAGAGYLKNSKEYKEAPDYKDEKEGVDPFSYYQYLCGEIEEVKTKEKLFDPNDFDDKNDIRENTVFSYGAIPFMFEK